MAGSIPEDTTSATSPKRSELAAEVADLLHQVNHRIRRVASAELEPLGITGAQMRAMRTLLSQPSGEPIRMSELADALGIVRRSATSVVDDLVHRGFAERVDDPHDRRAVGVVLTADGRRAMAEARGRRRSAAGQVFSALDRDDLMQLRQLLERLRC